MSEPGSATILILEDDPGVARLERLRLERAGYAVVAASTPEEGLKALGAGGIDLLVLDYQLAGNVTGLDVLGQVRDAGLRVPTILVTGFGDEAILTRALRAGVRDFLPKTADYLDFLATTVARVLAQVETERALAARQHQLDLERQRSGKLQRLAAIASGLNAALDVEAVLRILADEARVLTGAGRSVAPVDPEEGRAGAALAASPDNGTARDEAEPGEAGWDPDRRLAAPLLGRQGRAMGSVRLADKADGPFTADDRAIVVQLAQMAAVAVENARFYRELRDNDRRKDEFLAMLAHELRNPLAAIDGAVQVGLHSGLAEHADWAHEVIRRQSRQLARLIDDLLDVARISRGKIALRRKTIDLAAVAARAIESVGPQVDAKRHAVAREVSGGPFWVDADPARIEQVLVNVLGNAAKYTPAGGRIALTARREGREAVVEVADDGIGIAPDMLSRIFDQFIQVEQAIDRAPGGLGIGLTLVRRLLEMHGGSVSARSKGLGQGSVFTLRLPLVEAPSPRNGAPPPRGDPAVAAPAATGARTRVLVVDDSIDTARALSRLLVAAGHEVRTVHDGADALDAARIFHPSILLLDIGLPSLDGYEVASRVRGDRDRELAGATLIAISGYGTEHDRKRSREAGFDHHLVKPVDFDALFALIDAAPAHAAVIV